MTPHRRDVTQRDLYTERDLQNGDRMPAVDTGILTFRLIESHPFSTIALYGHHPGHGTERRLRHRRSGEPRAR